MLFICLVDVPFAVSKECIEQIENRENFVYPQKKKKRRNAMVFNLLNGNFKAYLSFKYKDGFTAQIYIL